MSTPCEKGNLCRDQWGPVKSIRVQVDECGGGGLVTKLGLTLATSWTVACKFSLSMGFSRQEHWSGLPFLSPGDLPDPGIKPGAPALQADSLLTELLGKPQKRMQRLRVVKRVSAQGPAMAVARGGRDGPRRVRWQQWESAFVQWRRTKQETY